MTTQPEPTEAQLRKGRPVVTGCFDYFADALLAISEVSVAGNEQHNPGQPLHWDRSKSTDDADCMGRHMLQRGTFDTDGKRHTVKMAWRALAVCQKELEEAKKQCNTAIGYPAKFSTPKFSEPR